MAVPTVSCSVLGFYMNWVLSLVMKRLTELIIPPLDSLHVERELGRVESLHTRGNARQLMSGCPLLSL